MPAFYDGQQDYIDKLNEMYTAFVAGPYSAVPISGNVVMTGPLTIPTLIVGAGGATGITKAMVGLGIVDNTSDAGKPVSTAQQAALDAKASLAGAAFTGPVSGISKSMVGLGNVDNTSDANKPVSTAQQTALDAKAPRANPTFSGNATIDSAATTKLVFRNSGTDYGGIGASVGYCFRAANAAGTAYVLDLDNSGVMTLTGGLITAGLRPNADNTVPGGTAAFRFTALYAASGTINTSDATHKTPVAPLNGAEIAAAEALALEIGTYKFLDAVEAKGDAARLHVGMTVQRAIDIMEARGLAPFSYGFICLDEWGESEDRAAGSIYSFRPDELNAFISRGLAFRLATMESRLAALENSSV